MSALLACQRHQPTDCAQPRADQERCGIARKHAGPAAAARGATGDVARQAAPETIPHLPLHELSAAERRLFFDVVDDQFDPCGKARSFGETLRKHQEDCPLAVEVARFVIARVRAGEERREIVLALLDRLRRQHNRSSFRLEGRPRRGPADAKVTVVEFYDYQCPFCAEVRAAVEAVVGRFPDVALVMKQLPIEGHPAARPAAKAALAAALQGRFWQMHAALFRRGTALDEAGILAAAKEAGVDLAPLRADAASLAVETMLREDREDADWATIEGTPSFWVDGVEVLFDDLERALRDRLRPAR